MACVQQLSEVLGYLPPRLRAPLERSRAVYEPTVHEIVLRTARPLCVYCSDRRYYLSTSACLIADRDAGELIGATPVEIRETVMRLCDYSVYSRQDELNRGYLTTSGGARVGVCGTAVIRDDRVVNLRRITTLSFRIPREVIGCGEKVLGLIRPTGGALICGAPCSGKTTLLRDMARLLSYTYKVSVIDERGELAAAGDDGGYDLGLCDVYVHMPKGVGVMNAIRSMAPDIIVCDELGEEADVASVRYALRCGVAFLATVHAATIDDLRSRPVTRELIATGAFRYLIFLGDRRSCGTVSRIYEWSAGDA